MEDKKRDITLKNITGMAVWFTMLVLFLIGGLYMVVTGDLPNLITMAGTGMISFVIIWVSIVGIEGEEKK